MTFETAQFDKRVLEFEREIERALNYGKSDERVIALKELLLAQLRACAAHYKLMAAEVNGPALLTESAFASILNQQLELSKFFQQVPKYSEKSTYEMKSVYPLYTFLDRHFKEGA